MLAYFSSMTRILSFPYTDDVLQGVPAALPPMKLQDALDGVMRDSLRPLATGLSVLYAVSAVSHRWTLPPTVSGVMALVATATAIVLLGLSLLLRRWSVPTPWAHPIGVGVAGLVLINSLLHLFLLSEPQQTTNLMLLAVGAGCLFLSSPWLVLTLVVIAASWGGVVWSLPPSPSWVHFGFGLIAASVLSLIVHMARVQAFRRLETLRAEREKAEETRLRAELAETAKQVLEKEVAERKQVEEVQRDREARLDAIFRTVSDAIVTVDMQGMVTDVSPAAEVMIGYPREELIGQPMELFLTSESMRVLHDRSEKAKRGEPLSAIVELEARRRDGTTLPLESKARFLREDGQPVSVVAILRDVTEKRAIEQQRADFLAMLTHDIRNPLGVILGYTDLLTEMAQQRGATEEEKILSKLHTNALTVHSLVTNYLDLSRIEARHLDLAKKPMALNDVLRQVERQYEAEARRRHLSLEMSLQEGLPAIEGNPLALERVFANLLQNALKFTPALGRVTLSSAQHDEGVVAAVTDTGPGIAPEEIPSLFEKYKRAQSSQYQEGTGLGLFIARALVEAHGGRIEVASVPGQGAQFAVVFPVASLRAQASL
jgi:two-component system phosphate regulon sensor histidine kinase PhoR